MYGSFVRSLRVRCGLSQRELAAVAGISQPNLSAIERDRRLPSVATLHRLVAACGFELAAVGSETIALPWPRVGWFPDDDLPPAVDGDPQDEPPVLGAATPIDERIAVLHEVLAAASAAVAADG